MICKRATHNYFDALPQYDEINAEVRRNEVIMGSSCPTCGGDLVIETMSVTRDGATKQVKTARCKRKRWDGSRLCREPCFFLEVDLPE